jgi:hypothetical protein
METDVIRENDKIKSMHQNPNIVLLTNEGTPQSLNIGFWTDLKTHRFNGELDGLDVKVAKEAFDADSNAKLFIVVVNINNKKNEDKKIYYIHKTLSIDPTDISDENRKSVNKEWGTLKKSIGAVKEDKVISFGKKVYDTLLVNKKISNGSDETSGVWIYCIDEMIYPIWEWLYDEDRKFFWGDKFHIVRIPNGCDMAKECTLNELIILEDKTPQTKDTAEYRISSIKSNLKHLTSFLHIRSLASFQKHAVDNPELLELLKSCMLYFPMDLPGEVLADLDNIFKNRNNKNLLLYPHTQLTGFSNYPSTWIDSRLNVPKSQTSQFFKYFCDVLDDHLTKPEKANIAKIVTETRKKMCGQEPKDQGGYNSWGWWKLHLPAVVGSHLPPAREESNAIGFWRLAYVVNGNPRTYLGCAHVLKSLKQISSSKTERCCG